MDQPHCPDPSTGWGRSRAAWLALPILIALLFGFALPARSAPPFAPTSTPDRLATPVVPDNPTPIDLGRKVYYNDCMPCHGDRGQGLTEEWRNVWVEDHRNCWARGCHGGRADDGGFPLPPTIPAVIGPEANHARFESSTDLLTYLQRTHPPQRPGALSVADYEEVTAFLWHENQRAETVINPTLYVMIGGGVTIVAASIILIYHKRRTSRSG